MPVIGTQQSPIEIDVKKAILMAGAEDFLKIEYPEEALKGEYKEKNFRINENAPPAPIQYGSGEPWYLRQIHIHKGPEHTIAEHDSPSFECHLVHSRKSDVEAEEDKLVIGILFHILQGKGKEKASLPPSLEALARAMSQARSKARGKVEGCATCEVNPWDFLPTTTDGRNRWFRYEGSLTGKPFTEDVSWIVLDEVITVPRNERTEEILKFAEHEVRGPQPLNRRFVLRNFPVEGEKPTAHKPAATLAAKAPKGKRARA